MEKRNSPQATINSNKNLSYPHLSLKLALCFEEAGHIIFNLRNFPLDLHDGSSIRHLQQQRLPRDQ